jgi:hypothetical protein
LIGVDPVILASARRHGIDDEDMLHAYRNPEGVEFIVHAMAARPKFLET